MSTTDTTMPYKGSFSYKNNNINVIIIDNNVRAMIERVANGVARLYFVNSHGVQIPVPANITLRNTVTNQIQAPYHNEYFITWFNNYTLYLNGIAFFGLENQQQQVIKGGSDLETDLIQQ